MWKWNTRGETSWKEKRDIGSEGVGHRGRVKSRQRLRTRGLGWTFIGREGDFRTS